MRHAANVDDNEAEREQHGHQQDAEPRRNTNQLDVPERILRLNAPEQAEHREKPPRVPKQRLIWSGVDEEIALAAEIQEVGNDFEHPVGLHQDERADVEVARFSAEEWLILDPRYYVVETPLKRISIPATTDIRPVPLTS